MKKITKILGIAVTIAVLASLMVVASPVSPAAAGTLVWSTQTIPSTLTFQLAAGTDVAFVKVAPNGDLFAVDTAAATDVVYKSVDGGRTWTPSVPVAAGIVDLEVSPAYATDSTVFVVAAGAATSQVYISTNGGISFAVLGGTVAGTASSLAVAPNYVAGVGEVMVGTYDAAAATYGNVYIWGKNGVLNWTATGLTEDITDVAYSPNFQIDFTRIAIGSVAGAAGTRAHTLVASDATWDLTLGTIATVDAAIKGVGDGATAIVSSVIALPADFNASVFTNRTIYVGTVSGSATDYVYRLAVGSGAAAVGLTPLGVYGGTDHEVTSLAHAGTTFAGTLFAGTAFGGAPAVVKVANPASASATTVWTPALAGPTGVGTTYVVLAQDFATSNKVYAGTSGANSALSVSTDAATYFYQAGLIDTTVASIQDFQAASPTEFFMLTSDGGAGADSLWKTTDGGLSWYRWLSTALTNNTGVIELSPNYATDKTVIVAATGAGATALQISNNAGATWSPRTSPVAIADIAVKDMYTIYVASAAAAQVQATLNAGWTWQPVATAITGYGILNDIAVAANGHILVGDVAGRVAISTNGNVSYTPLAAGAAVGGSATPTIVAFDTNYATNNIIYAAATGAAGIWRYTVGTSTTWGTASIDGGLCALPRDIVLAPDGTLYASDFTAAAAAAGGVVRVLSPTDVVVSSAERVTATLDDGLPAGDTLSKLALTTGSNILFAIAGTNVRTYSDTLAMGSTAPVMTSPINDAILDSTTCVFDWDAVAGATLYRVQYSTRADWVGATTVDTTVLYDTFIPQAITANGAKYYWRVRVLSPVFGPWSSAQTFFAQLSTAGPSAPVPQGPAAGGTNQGGYDAPLQPTFSWSAVKAATGYEFQLATDPQMLFPIVDLTGADALTTNTYKLTEKTLDYSTTYYWRVRAITATTTTDWSEIVVFTTMAKPTPPVTPTVPAVTPTVIVPTQPAPTISVAPPTVTVNVPTQPPAEVKEIAPAYIWAIIIIGAILVIAVIVLIVRTRRTV